MHLETLGVSDSLQSLIVEPLTGWECPKKLFSCCHTIDRLGDRGTSPPWKISFAHNSSVRMSDSHEIEVPGSKISVISLSSSITI